MNIDSKSTGVIQVSVKNGIKASAIDRQNDEY